MRLLIFAALLSIPAAFGQGTIQTIAGTGTCGFSGDNGPAAQAGICSSQGVAVDSAAGSIYFADTLNYRIRKIATTGVITTVAGSGIHGSDGDNGTAVYASLGNISHVVIDSGGGFVVFSDPEAHKIRYFDTSGGAIHGIGTGNPVSAGDGLPWTSVSFNQPSGLVTFFAVSGGGGGGGGPVCTYPLAYVADAADNMVRRLDASANSTIVGPGTPGQLGDGGPATAASLLNPGGLAYYNCGLFIADTGHHRIRRVDLSTGIITTVAGDGTPAFGGDGGPATSAQISSPTYITVDPNGNLYFTDSGNLRLRRIDTAGVIATVAGDGGFGFGPDNVPATTSAFMGVSGAALLSYPTRLLTSDGSSRLRQVLFGQTTQMGLSISPNPVLQGNTVNLTATVVPSGATGTVTFTANSNTIGTFSLAFGQAMAIWYPLDPGSYSVTASYSGDSNYAPSSVTSTVNVQTATTTALSSNLNPSTQGQAVTFTMTVTPAASTGTADLFGTLNGSPLYLGRATLVNGIASITTSTLGVGSNVLHAVYNSDTTHARSTSADLTQVVNAPLTSTTTGVTSSPNPSIATTPVTLTATVSPSTATGSVQFYSNGTSLGTATLSGGQAQITTSSLPAGVDSLTAAYSGDANNAASISSQIQQTVKTASTTTLSSYPSPSTYGQSVTLTATVHPTAASGTVEFFVGPTSLGIATIANGQAQLATTSLGGGTNALTATYGGDANTTSSTSAVLPHTVNRVATTTTLSANPSPSNSGQSVTLTATVTPAAATGTVQFFNGATSLGTATIVSGQVQLTTSSLPVGTNSLTSTYNGDANNAASASAAIQQTVNKIASTTTLAASPSPSITGQSVTLTASVTPTNGTGTVQFFNGANSLGTATITGGQAQLAITTLPIGTNSLTASYSGDATNASSTSAAIQQTVNKVASTTTLSASPSPSNSGQSVTLTATVTPAAATGTVQFFNGATSLGTATIASGQAQLATTVLAAGTNSLTATYSGDATNASSTSAAIQQTVNKVASTTTLSASPTPSNSGQSVTLTATGTPAAATGTVQFFNGATSLGTATIISGQAQLATTALPLGTNSLTATYSGDATTASSTSAAIQQTVNQAASATTLAASPSPSSAGQSVALTASVTPSNATGTVQFFNGATSLGSSAITNGQAQIATTSLPAGTNSLTATYGGDANTAASTSAAIQQTVNQVASTTTLGLYGVSNPSTYGATITLIATVSPSAATGTVQFLDGSTTLATVAVSNGQAPYSTTTLPLGTHSLTASYSGDANNAASTSSAIQQTVMKIVTTVALAASPSPSTLGQPVTLTASLTPSNSTGVVHFYAGATQVGTANVSSGQAQFTTSALPAGANSLYASYDGDETHSSNSSGFVQQTVNKANAATTLAASPSPSTLGQVVTLTATVTPSTATGTVQFFKGSTSLGTAPVTNGQAQVTTTTLTVGSNSLTATYSGDTSYNTSTSGAFQQTVNKTSSATALSASPTPSTLGQAVTLTATLTPSTATGSVQFFNGATPLGSAAVSGGQAQLTTTALPVGTNSLTATYGGDANTAASTSPGFQQTVNKASSATGISTSPASPTVGQTVNIVATVTPTATTGTVNFYKASTLLGSSAVSNGQAIWPVTVTAAGTSQLQNLQAVYQGDSSYNPSSSGVITVTVQKGATGATIASSLNPSVQGEAVTFTATLTPTAATGTVLFSGVGTATVANGIATITTSALAAGVNTISAQYNGDANYNASTSAGLAQTVKVSTTTSLTSSPNPSTFGGSVTLNATVTPSNTNGSVQFFNGGTLVGSASLSAGHAMLSTTALPTGTLSLTAIYTGNATSAPSASSVRTQTVSKANSSTTYSASPSSPAHVGQTVTFTATVTSSATGTVNFTDSGTTIGTVTISNGTAVFSTSSLTLGNHSIRAVYSGDGNFNSSQSGQQTYRIIN